jgi:hypothetical protein
VPELLIVDIISLLSGLVGPAIHAAQKTSISRAFAMKFENDVQPLLDFGS